MLLWKTNNLQKAYETPAVLKIVVIFHLHNLTCFGSKSHSTGNYNRYATTRVCFLQIVVTDGGVLI